MEILESHLLPYSLDGESLLEIKFIRSFSLSGIQFSEPLRNESFLSEDTDVIKKGLVANFQLILDCLGRNKITLILVGNHD